MSGIHLAIGVDFGATVVKGGVVYQGHVIDHALPISTMEFTSPGELIEAIVGMVGSLKERHPGVAALGVGVPGLVNFNEGLVLNLTNVADWQSIRLASILEEKAGLPTVVDNRANCMAIAEWKRGAARGLQDVVFLNLETGVGGAIIANGEMIRGSRFVAGEIGQTSIDWQGREGRYGNPGALEKYLGSAEIAADTQAIYASAGIQKPLNECMLPALMKAAHQHDPIAMIQWDELGRMLAAAVANACWLLNPEAVVVAGSITRAGELLFKPLRESLFSQLTEPFKDHLMVLPAAFGHEAGMIGAAALAVEGSRLTV